MYPNWDSTDCCLIITEKPNKAFPTRLFGNNMANYQWLAISGTIQTSVIIDWNYPAHKSETEGNYNFLQHHQVQKTNVAQQRRRKLKIAFSPLTPNVSVNSKPRTLFARLHILSIICWTQRDGSEIRRAATIAAVLPYNQCTESLVQESFRIIMACSVGECIYRSFQP